MDWNTILELFNPLEINLFLLIPFGVAVSLVSLCFCYHCHQCVRDRRRARIEKRVLPLPLTRLSITPISIVDSTKLIHSRNSSEYY